MRTHSLSLLDHWRPVFHNQTKVWANLSDFEDYVSQVPTDIYHQGILGQACPVKACE